MYDLGDRIKNISWKGCNISRLITSLAINLNLYHMLTLPGKSKKLIGISMKHGADVTGVNRENGQNILHVISSDGLTGILSTIERCLEEKNVKDKLVQLLDQKCNSYKKQPVMEKKHTSVTHLVGALYARFPQKPTKLRPRDLI